jgi:hypothetical protein
MEGRGESKKSTPQHFLDKAPQWFTEKYRCKEVRRAAHFCEILFNVIAKEIG